MIEFSEYAKLLIALMAIVDIPGNIPMFLQQTASMSPGGRRLAGLSAGVASGVVLLTFAFLGEPLLGVFGITIHAFKILGGIVVLLIALDMLGLMGVSASNAEAGDAPTHPIAVGVFPMAVPLFAGPGAIAAVMVFGHEEFHSNHDLIVAAVIGTTALAIALSLMAASGLGRFIGPVTQSVLNRLLGMIVGALGVEFILEGVAGFFPALTIGG